MEFLSELLKQAARARREGRLEDARRVYAEAVQESRGREDKFRLIEALKGLGQIERDRGELDGALAKYEEAARLASETGEATLLAHTVRHLGDILRKMARTAEAEKRYETLGIYRAQPDTTPLDLANAFRGMAVLKDEIGERGIARALWEEASRLYALAGVDAGVAECRKRIEEIEI